MVKRQEAMDEVRDEAAHCTSCPLYAHATQTVFGEGPANAAVIEAYLGAGHQPVVTPAMAPVVEAPLEGAA